jgi:hypothetical protein
MKRACMWGVVVAIAATASILFAPTEASAQVMVCQTPAFWCAFPGSAPSGLGCYCMTLWGPVTGYSINPNEITQRPPPPERRPMPRPDYSPRSQPSEEEIDLAGRGNDCLNGLGNCQGAFRGYKQNRR